MQWPPHPVVVAVGAGSNLPTRTPSRKYRRRHSWSSSSEYKRRSSPLLCVSQTSQSAASAAVSFGLASRSLLLQRLQDCAGVGVAMMTALSWDDSVRGSAVSLPSVTSLTFYSRIIHPCRKRLSRNLSQYDYSESLSLFTSFEPGLPLHVLFCKVALSFFCFVLAGKLAVALPPHQSLF